MELQASIRTKKTTTPGTSGRIVEYSKKEGDDQDEVTRTDTRKDPKQRRLPPGVLHTVETRKAV